MPSITMRNIAFMPRDAIKTRASKIFLCLLSSCLLATGLHSEEALSEFVDVQTRKYVDEIGGFTLEYPYEWEPSSDPVGNAYFYVGAPFSMPSFSLDVTARPDDLELTKALDSVDGQEYPNHKGIEPYLADFNDHEALWLKINWETNDAGRHFIETTVVSFFTADRWFTLRVNQTYRESRWRPRLQAILDSFRVIEPES